MSSKQTTDKKYDFLAIGELLMDMTPVKGPQGIYFQPNPGGAPCNFLAMAQKMGSQTGFIGKVGGDQFGQQLRQTLIEVGVDPVGLIVDPSVPTTLAFVHLTEEGDRSFSFYRKHCADVSLHQEEVDFGLLDHAKALYFGSLAFTDEPLRSTTLALLKQAEEKGLTICYDPNYRPLLWPSVEEAVAAMRHGLRFTDVLKVSDEEALLLTKAKSLEEAANALAAENIPLVCVTLGAKGALIAFKNQLFSVPATKVNVVDTTGAGDAFFGTLMHQLIQAEQPISAISLETLTEIVRVANKAAGLCVEHYGAIPALPEREQVLAKG